MREMQAWLHLGQFCEFGYFVCFVGDQKTFSEFNHADQVVRYRKNEFLVTKRH